MKKIQYILVDKENVSTIDEIINIVSLEFKIDLIPKKLGKITSIYLVHNNSVNITFRIASSEINTITVECDNINVLDEFRSLQSNPNFNKRYYIISTYDDVSITLAKKWYPLILKFEVALKCFLATNLYYNYKEDTFKLLSTILKKDEYDNLNKKLKGKKDNFFQEFDYNTLNSFIFTPYILDDDYDDIFTNVEVKILNKKEIIKKFKEYKGKSLWNRIFNSMYFSYDIEEFVKDIQELRNKVMHFKKIEFKDINGNLKDKLDILTNELNKQSNYVIENKYKIKNPNKVLLEFEKLIELLSESRILLPAIKEGLNIFSSSLKSVHSTSNNNINELMNINYPLKYNLNLNDYKITFPNKIVLKNKV